jgi:hypothetical protein
MCQTPQAHPSNRYAITENVDTDNAEAETSIVEISELTVISPEDSHVNIDLKLDELACESLSLCVKTFSEDTNRRIENFSFIQFRHGGE